MLWNRSNDFLKVVLLVSSAWVFALTPGTLRADEKSDKDEASRVCLENFITQLRLNGFGDLGIYYLEQMKADNKLPESFKPEYDFQLALQTDAAAQILRKNEDRLKMYDTAIALLEKYIKERPDGPNYYLAIGLLPNIRLNKTLTYQSMSTYNDPKDEDTSKYSEEDKKNWEKRCAEFKENQKKYAELSQAELKKNIEFLTAHEQAILANAKKLNPDDEKEKVLRNNMLNELHNIRMARGNTYYELARTYPEGSKERTENLDKARIQYKFFWDKYAEQGLLIAFRGHVNEAKMLIAMKKYTGKGEAIEVLADLYSGLKGLVGRDDILTQVFVEVCTCYLEIFADKEANVQPTKDQGEILLETIETFDPSKNGTILNANAIEKTDAGVRMRLAYIHFMEFQLEKQHPKDEAKRRATLKEDVRRLYQIQVSAYRPEITEMHKKFFPEEHIGDEDTNYTFSNYRAEFKKKQALNLKKPADKRDNLYIDIRRFALKEFSNYYKARTELQTATDPARKEELQKIVTENPAKILKVFELLESIKYDAIHARQIEMLITDRFYRAQMCYCAGKQYESIALLDFISQRYASSMQVSNALFYELAYLNVLIVNEYREVKKLIQSGKLQLNQSEITEMFRGELELLATCIELKETMLQEPKKYSLDNDDGTRKMLTNKPMADEWEVLCKLCLMVGAVDMAQEYIDRIPTESENRAALELSIGFSLWNMYIEFKRADDEHKPYSLQQAEGYQKLALELLESGAQKLKKQVKSADDVTGTVVAAAMTLCDSYSRRGDNANAIKWLRDEKIGPYKLLCDGHPAVTDDKKDKILNIALVAFVSENDMDSAFDAMDRLEKLAAEGGEDGDMDEKLTRKYMSLGFQLRDNLQSMVASGDPETLKQVKLVQTGFEEFLKRISKRENGNSYASLNWIAQTFISLAEGSQESGSNTALNPEARKYYESAVETYKMMLERLNSDPDFVADADEEKLEKRRVFLQQKIAATYESLEMFQEANEFYCQLLAAHPGYINLQYKLLNMYVAWSRSITDDMKLKGNLLVQANMGIKSPDKKKTICNGWSKVVRNHNGFQLVGSDQQKRWMYYYATYREAEINLLFGLAKGGYASDGKRYIDAAFNAIKGVFEAGDGSDNDFGGSVPKLDADGMPTDEYVVVSEIVCEPLMEKYETLLKRIQEIRGEEPTGFANWKREIVDDTPLNEDAHTESQIEDNDQQIQIENARLATEEDLARKMMTPQAKPMPPYVTYGIAGGAGLVFLIMLVLMMRRGKSDSAKRRAAMIKDTKLTNDAAILAAPKAEEKVASIGIGDEVVDTTAAAGLFASMGLGDAPVIIPEEKKEVEAPAFNLNFGAAPTSAPASKPVSKPTAAPAEKSAPAENSAPAEKPVVKKVVKKPVPAAETTSDASDADGEKRVVKKVMKKVVKKPVEGAAPTVETPSSSAPAESADKPAKKVIKLVKKPTDNN